MAERVEWFDVSVTAMTAKASAVETNVSFDQGVVERIEITIPDGHAGLTGIRLLQAHTPVIPSTSNAYIIGNDRTLSWDLTNYLDNGGWSVQCFNTDQYDHTFHIAFLVNELSAGTNLTFTSPSGLVVVGAAPPAVTPDIGVAADIPAFTGT